jgi:large subunit ribosomal protein L3
MAIGILGRKVGMTQLYDEAGQVVPVTVIQAGPCDVLQVRTVERDGYEAVQLGFADKPRRLASRSVRGHVAKLESKRSKKRSGGGVELLAKADCEPKRFIREIRGPAGELAVGGKVNVDALANVKCVDVTAICKGRGFSGAIRRHNFSGQRATHGVKKCHRALGGTGASAFPRASHAAKTPARMFMLDREGDITARPIAQPPRKIFARKCWALALARRRHVS